MTPPILAGAVYRCRVSASEVVVGIDFGTSNTAAVLQRGDGPVRPVLFDGAPLLPSAVFADESGILVVGRDALHAGGWQPHRLEPYPKQRIDDGTVLLGNAEKSVVDLVAAVLRRVAEEAARVAGRPPDRAVLTCPAGWGQRRRGTLREAGEYVFGQVELVVEPVAAASLFVTVVGSQLPAGGCAVVYDLGAGTFDVAVVRRTSQGLEVLAAEGLADAGGLDIDAAVVGYLGTAYAVRDPDRWQRLTAPQTDADRRLSRQLWNEVRVGKEVLSRASRTQVLVPLFDDAAPLGREQLDQLAGPVLHRTITATRDALRTVAIPAADVAGVYLVGGASRIPLVATLLHRSLGVAPTVVEQPELAVAEGSLRTQAATGQTGTTGMPTAAAEPAPATTPITVTTASLPAPPSGRRHRRLLRLVVPALLLAVAAAGAFTLLPDVGKNNTGASDQTPSTTAAMASIVGDECVVGTWELVNSVIPDVNFDGNPVDLTGRGTIYHYRPDGTGLTEFNGVTWAGDAGGNRYEHTITGKMTWRYRASNGHITYTDTRVEGRSVLKINGTVREDEPLTAAADDAPAPYRCTTASMSFVSDTRTTELERRSTTPG